MRTVGKILAGICVLLFVISGMIAIISFNIERKAFSSDTYKQAFENQNLYERIPAVLAVALSTSIAGDGNAVALMSILSTQENIAALLPPQELKVVANDMLDATFDYLNGGTDSAVVSVVSLKRYLANEGGTKTITQLLSAQPDCTLEQVTQITLGLLSGGNLLLCNPPEELLGVVTPLIESQLQILMGNLPDDITIINGEKSNTPDDPRIRLGRVRAIMKLTVALPLLLLPALVIFAVRSIKDLLIWWGWPLLLTGGISLFVALIGAPIVEFFIGRAMQTQMSDFMPPVLLATMRETVGEITRQILNPVAVEGVIILFVGLGMIIFGVLLTRLEGSNV